MYELVVKRRFSAAHQLRGYHGKCENLHGHTYRVDVFVRADKINDIGLAADFKELKIIIDALLDRFDHHLANEVPPFDRLNPSAENMARVFFEELKKQMPSGVVLSKITVWESEDAGATYSEP
jgi:6-pyruvoyltetrahydropterin/6-carboxytetrahydropterin synthase